MLRMLASLSLVAVALATASAAPVPERAAYAAFLVEDTGLVFLGPDGREKERLKPYAGCGALSPDGRWLACVESDRGPAPGKLVIRSLTGASAPATVPLIWGQPGTSGCLPVWAADGCRVLIGEERPRQHAHRVYELATKKLIAIKLPDKHWVTGWSADGKRFLTTFYAGDATPRIAWLKADGTGEPEFLTPEGEAAFRGRLSPDGRRVLFQAGPRGRVRLYAMDLSSKKRTPLDEPGETYGYCWSPDGSRVAYTWQQSIDKPGAVPERETLLITCDRDGRNRKTITSRKYRPTEADTGVVFYFTVVDWR